MLARGLQSRGSTPVSSVSTPDAESGANLDDFIPHPVARRRKQGKDSPGGMLDGPLPQSLDRPAKGLVLALIGILVISCIYALQINIRLSRMEAELADPDGALPPATVSMLEKIAEDRVADKLHDAKMHIALEIEKTTKDILTTTVHRKTQELAKTLLQDMSSRMAAEGDKSPDEDVGEDGTAGDTTADTTADTNAEALLNIPGDLIFDDLQGWIKQNLENATKDMVKRPKYVGPLDMEDEITKKAKELDAEWKAKGSPKLEQPGIKIAMWEKYPAWPFQKLKNMQGKQVGVIGVAAPMVSINDYYWGQEERGNFWRLKNTGHLMLGISSYEHFPGEIINPADNRFVNKVEGDKEMYASVDGWLHCQRDPDNMGLPPGVPRALISESDFSDPLRNDSGGVMLIQNIPKQYDFLYVNNRGSWNDYNRNFTLAKKCMVKMAEMGYTVCLRSKDVENEPELAPYVKSGKIIVHKFELWRDFLKLIESSRAIFTPCVSDASPRSAAEAMSKNVPLLMNYHIVGGWKYVNDKTGVLFHDEHDIEASIRRLMSPEFQAGLSPRKWFMDNWAPYNSALRLQAFLELTVGKERVKEAMVDFVAKNTKRVA